MTNDGRAELPWACVPADNVLADDFLSELPLDLQGAASRVWLRWWKKGSLPADPAIVAIRAGIPLAPHSSVTAEAFATMLNTFAPVTDAGDRQLPAAWQAWRERGEKGYAANQYRTARMRWRKLLHRHGLDADDTSVRPSFKEYMTDPIKAAESLKAPMAGSMTEANQFKSIQGVVPPEPHTLNYVAPEAAAPLEGAPLGAADPNDPEIVEARRKFAALVGKPFPAANSQEAA